jgi:Mg2+/Co2+ transporter CorB
VADEVCPACWVNVAKERARVGSRRAVSRVIGRFALGTLIWLVVVAFVAVQMMIRSELGLGTMELVATLIVLLSQVVAMAFAALFASRLSQQSRAVQDLFGQIAWLVFVLPLVILAFFITKMVGW